MQIDRILYPVTALGPGNRIGIWTVGCQKKCKNCANPELRNFDETKDITLEQFMEMIASIDHSKVDGITVSGGEPFCQPEQLLVFLKRMKTMTKDILVFSGYTMDELLAMDNKSVRACLKEIDVLICGEYVDEMNDNKTALLGSLNQNIIFFNKEIKENYRLYMDQGRQIQNVFYGDSMMSIGIHNRKEQIIC